MLESVYAVLMIPKSDTGPSSKITLTVLIALFEIIEVELSLSHKEKTLLASYTQNGIITSEKSFSICSRARLSLQRNNALFSNTIVIVLCAIHDKSRIQSKYASQFGCWSYSPGNKSFWPIIFRYSFRVGILDPSKTHNHPSR